MTKTTKGAKPVTLGSIHDFSSTNCLCQMERKAGKLKKSVTLLLLWVTQMLDLFKGWD